MINWVLFDWGDTLMLEEGPADLPMALWPDVPVIHRLADLPALIR